MTIRSFTQILAIAAMLVPFGLQAQSLSDLQNMTPEERHTYLDSMSEQERQAKREQMRTRWEGMSDEERAAARNRAHHHHGAGRHKGHRQGGS